MTNLPLTLAMTAASLTASIASAQTSNNTPDMSWQNEGPVLLDAIYYDHLARSQQRQNLATELNQGAQVKAWAAENSVAVQPMVYNGAVDWYADNEYSDDDKLRFKNWIDEGDWWSQFDTSSQAAMDVVIDFYIEGLEYAQSLRPNAKIGYWGLPKKSHTKETSTTASVVRLLEASTALFPDVYDHNPTGNGSVRLQRHIETTIEMVQGQVPVYVQASPRYKLQGGQYDQLHTVEEFMRDQVDAALAAVWTDADGTEHRITGISMWDAYVYYWWYTENWTTLDSSTQKAMWDELDAYHVELLGHMKNSVDAAYAAAQERIETEKYDTVIVQVQETATTKAQSTTQQSRWVRTLQTVSSKSTSSSLRMAR